MTRPVVALVGPTGAGKSAIAMAAAERLDAEIVAVDAFTVYRGMDVGTAKPSPEDRARIPHHCIDLLPPSRECTVEWFQAQARAAVDDVHARGRLPLLVGGSGLYFRAVVDPLEFPPTDRVLRERIAARFAGDPRAAHDTLRRIDPDAAVRIDQDNVRRSIRALEVTELTGRPFSSYRQAWDAYDSIYPDLQVIGLSVPRAVLVGRIHARVDAMLEADLVDECRRLLEAGPLSTTARQAIGYAEIFDHLAGRCGVAEAAERIAMRTRRFAARQMRWFRKDPRVRWLEPSAATVGLAGS